jgi:hypothetical protein|nr:MAG TPA: hypothetical protein [Caudoviricetes sp.]
MATEPNGMIKNGMISIMVSDKRICEMVSEMSMINVPVDPRIDIDTITADDPDPKFVNVEVIRAGVSNNNRRYNNNIVKEISQLIVGCQGFFGHPDPSKYGFEFREPQCIYVGSIIDEMPDGLNRCIAKAYLFKTSQLREWVPKSIAAGNPMTVSINGSADIMRGGDIIDVVHMTDLQSVDWANPGTEGLETSRAMSVVTEMNEGGNKMAETINAQDIIKNVSVAELRAYNPGAYDTIIKGATVQELQAINPALVQSIIESNRITEMEFTIGGKKENVKVSELQAKFDGYEATITELNNKFQKAELDAYKNQKIAEMVDEDHIEAFKKRVTGNTKAEIDASINSEIEFVREMGGMNNRPAPRKAPGGDSDIKDAVARMFGVKSENK